MKNKKTAEVSKECVACGCCVKVCPLGAITVHKGKYAVISDKCVGCGKCADICPACVITIAEKEVAQSEQLEEKALV